MTAPILPSDAVRQAVLYHLNNVNTALPAAIVSYDYTTQKASVQPLLNKAWADDTSTPLPVIQNVPVIFPRAGGASLTFPVSTGDTCLLVFIQRSTDLWKTTGGQVTPDDNRKFSLSDAVAIMGLFSFSETSEATNNEDVLLTFAGSSIIIKANGDVIIKTSSKVAIGDTTTEVLDIVSRLLNILKTSLTTSTGSAIQQVPIPATGDTYTTLKTAIDNLKGTIP